MTESPMKQKVEKNRKFNFRYRTDKFEELIQVVNKSSHEETEYDQYIGRPSILSNPYSHKKDSKHAKWIVETRTEAIDSYEDYFEKMLTDSRLFMKALEKLLNFFKKHNKMYLVCFCKPKRCHGDVIKKYLIKRLRNE